jgi:membrane protein implicated in regulation of membrane protease activity
MTSYSAFNALIRQDPIFWFCALSGSFLFVIQFLMSFLGDSPDGIDDGGGEIDSGKLKWLSKQATTGFLMMFGWVGLTCRKEFDLPHFATILIAFAAGCFAIFATALIFNGAKKLRSAGTVFRIEDVIGKEATVYQRIAKGGIGKISLSLHDITYEVDAMSHLDEEIASFTQVHVIKKSDDKTVFVVPIK